MTAAAAAGTLLFLDVQFVTIHQLWERNTQWIVDWGALLKLLPSIYTCLTDEDLDDPIKTPLRFFRSSSDVSRDLFNNCMRNSWISIFSKNVVLNIICIV